MTGYFILRTHLQQEEVELLYIDSDEKMRSYAISTVYNNARHVDVSPCLRSQIDPHGKYTDILDHIDTHVTRYEDDNSYKLSEVDDSMFDTERWIKVALLHGRYSHYQDHGPGIMQIMTSDGAEIEFYN